MLSNNAKYGFRTNIYRVGCLGQIHTTFHKFCHYWRNLERTTQALLERDTILSRRAYSSVEHTAVVGSEEEARFNADTDNFARYCAVLTRFHKSAPCLMVMFVCCGCFFFFSLRKLLATFLK